jgi:anaerobic magnesium-protoporphyrin IX monomethyl ester cyclase
VISPQQVPQAIEVARRARQLWPHAFIVVGGPWVKLGRELLRDPRYGFLFDRFDAMETGDGEEPLLGVVARAPGSELLDVPNLLVRRDGVPVATSPKRALPLSALTDPDFDGIEFYLYIDPFVPVERASLCYRRRCLFCWHNHPDRAADVLPPEVVAGRVERHVQATGIRRISFIDNAVTGKYMLDLAHAILEKSLDIEWAMQARFEQDFLDPAYCRTLARSGCRLIFFGLETSDAASLRRFRKRIRIESVPGILARCHEAGIGVALYLMVYPGRTEEDFEATLRFCLGLREYIQIPIVQRFLLNCNCISHDQPSRLGIRPLPIEEPVVLDFFDLPYESERGMLDDAFIEAATRRFGRMLRER